MRLHATRSALGATDGDRVELEHGEVAHQVEQSGRALRVEQLGAHGDPARVGR